MRFYDHSREEREKITENIELLVRQDFEKDSFKNILLYSSDEDTYIRKVVYLSVGKLYQNDSLREKIIPGLELLYMNENDHVRQTAVYALGEIGKIDAGSVFALLEKALSDPHHSVRNAVTGSLKQMGEKNPKPVLKFAGKFANHENPEIRREIIHGIELRGRTHPEEVLPLLFQAQNDPDRKVRKMVVHVLGQISYKKGCLEKVIAAIKDWANQELVRDTIKEILKVHQRYERFSARIPEEAKNYMEGILKI